MADRKTGRGVVEEKWVEKIPSAFVRRNDIWATINKREVIKKDDRDNKSKFC
jgi:hypothetical protein